MSSVEAMHYPLRVHVRPILELTSNTPSAPLFPLKLNLSTTQTEVVDLICPKIHRSIRTNI